uniref:Uncharacterized protein n=1 Tax=viral metagenome TaxID=1070528 RepID=A0A6C0K535_9ZZZZ
MSLSFFLEVSAPVLALALAMESMENHDMFLGDPVCTSDNTYAVDNPTDRNTKTMISSLSLIPQ